MTRSERPPQATFPRHAPNGPGERGWVRAVAAGFRTAPAPSPAQLDGTLWNEEPAAVRPDESAAYLATLLDQYKLYVEMADRVSARRGLANTFFITLNSALLTAFGVVTQGGRELPAAALVIALAIALGLCLAWFWMVRSYRQLNAGKYAVVGALERRLPASPFWAAEWTALGQGRDRARYWPITHLEQWVPALFAVGYVAAFVVAVTSG